MKAPPPASSTTLFNRRTFTLALLAGLFLGLCGFLLDHLVHRANRLVASDLYTTLIAFALSYLLLHLEARRREQLTRRMAIAAEVNHHIRNALTGVIYTAAVRNDPDLQAVLHDATARIDWVLNTVLPDGAPNLQWPVQSPNWTPSAWQNPTRDSPEHPRPLTTAPPPPEPPPPAASSRSAAAAGSSRSSA